MDKFFSGAFNSLVFKSWDISIMKTVCNFYFVLMLIAYGCSSQSEHEEIEISSIVADTKPQVDSNSIVPVITDIREPNFVDSPILKRVYVTNRSLVKLYSEPSDKSKVADTLSYADWLDVIEILDGWCGVKHSEYRTFIEGPNVVSQWETAKYYVKTKFTGEFDDIELIAEDLNVISYEHLYTGPSKDYFNYYDNGKLQNEFVKVELTTKSIYESKRKDAVSYFIDDSDSIKKIKGVISLACENKIVKLKDDVKPEFDEGYTSNNYLGQLEAINSYLVRTDLYESSAYKIINREDGEVFSMIDIPYISADKSKMIVVSHDYYEGNSRVALYSLSSNKPTLIAEFNYKNWIPSDKPNTMFWDTDGYFYFKANHSAITWKDEERNENYQYLRMRIL